MLHPLYCALSIQSDEHVCFIIQAFHSDVQDVVSFRLCLSVSPCDGPLSPLTSESKVSALFRIVSGTWADVCTVLKQGFKNSLWIPSASLFLKTSTARLSLFTLEDALQKHLILDAIFGVAGAMRGQKDKRNVEAALELLGCVRDKGMLISERDEAELLFYQGNAYNEMVRKCE